MKKIKLFFTKMLFIFVCECADCAELNLTNEEANSWANDLVQNCVSFTGEYLSIGEASIPNALNIKFPKLERAVFGLDKLGIEVNSVFIEQLPEFGLKVALKNSDGAVVFSQDFNRSRMCSGSWLISESKIKGSGDGSSVLETHAVTKMARSNDGSLIVFIHVNTISRNWFVMKKSESFDVWYRFFKLY